MKRIIFPTEQIDCVYVNNARVNDGIIVRDTNSQFKGMVVVVPGSSIKQTFGVYFFCINFCNGNAGQIFCESLSELIKTYPDFVFYQLPKT